MKIFSLTDIKEAFEAAQMTVIEDDRYTDRCPKYDSFEEWFEESNKHRKYFDNARYYFLEECIVSLKNLAEVETNLIKILEKEMNQLELTPERNDIIYAEYVILQRSVKTKKALVTLFVDEQARLKK
jgi:hypothetical protein